MSVQLLDKTRKIGKLLHNNNSNKVVFNDICQVLSEILDSNILVINQLLNLIDPRPGADPKDLSLLADDQYVGIQNLT